MVSPPLEQRLIRLLRLLGLDIIRSIADGVVALLQVQIVAIDDATASLLLAQVALLGVDRLAVLLLAHVE